MISSETNIHMGSGDAVEPATSGGDEKGGFISFKAVGHEVTVFGTVEQLRQFRDAIVAGMAKVDAEALLQARAQ